MKNQNLTNSLAKFLKEFTAQYAKENGLNKSKVSVSIQDNKLLVWVDKDAKTKYISDVLNFQKN